MNTKNKLNEHTANLALSQAPAIVIGRNFAKPVPRLAKTVKAKSFMEKLLGSRKKV
jgi:hypothetical protein